LVAFRTAGRIVRSALGLVELAFGLKFLVVRDLAGGILDGALHLAGLSRNLFHHFLPVSVDGKFCPFLGEVRWGAVGVIVDMEERPAPNSGSDYRVRARFGDFITPWIEAWQLERVS
jgi:hypothetical protein